MSAKIENLLYENDRLTEQISLQVSEILSYSNKADLVDPEDALCYLSNMYIDNCGVSRGMRGFADYCADFWIERLKREDNPETQAKYKDAEVLVDFLPFLSDDYTEEVDKYDSCFMSNEALRDILIEELEDAPDERTKIILCAGICDILSELTDNT